MKQDIIFEVIPPAKTASDSYRNKIADIIMNSVGEMKNVSTLNIPEIAEENHKGEPYYRNYDNRKFGLLLKERCKKEIIVNSVASYHNSKEKFEEWLDESITSYGLKNYVFVGPKIGSIRYPGPSVLEANSIAKGKKVNFGNIFIPERKNEADRLVSKTKSGCKFFTSQILFEPDTAIRALQEYSIQCAEHELRPAKVFLSFSPLSIPEDVSFVKWLGADISKRAEIRLLSSQNIGEESVRIILSGLHKILDFADDGKIKVPLGLNIEYVLLHNLELAKNLVHMVSDIRLPLIVK